MSTFTPTRFPMGLATAPKNHPLGNYPRPNPFAAHYYENDFDQYIAGDWIVTTSTGSTALAAANGGQLLFTTAATNTDIQANVKNPAAFAFVPGNQFWFICEFQLSDANLSGIELGVQTGGTAFAPTDGVFFTKASATSALVLNIRAASVSSLIQMGAIITTNATNYVVAFYYDGRAAPTLQAWAGLGSNKPTAGNQFDSFSSYWNSSQASQVLTNLPAAGTNLSTVMGIQAGAAAIKTMGVDYVGVASELVR